VAPDRAEERFLVSRSQYARARIEFHLSTWRDLEAEDAPAGRSDAEIICGVFSGA